LSSRRIFSVPPCQTWSTFERFTDRARRVLVLAQEEASSLNHAFIGTEHILLGLVSEGDGVAAKALRQLDVSLEKVRAKVVEVIGEGASQPPGAGSPPFTPRAKKVLELSLREALQLGHTYIGTEHLLLGVVREGEGVGAKVLVSMGVDLNKVRQQVVALLAGYQATGPGPRVSAPRPMMRLASPLEPGRRAVERVGKEWTARVVQAGVTPSSYAEAYEELKRLLVIAGVALAELDLSRIVVESVETEGGPGLALSISLKVEDDLDIEDDPDVEVDEETFGESP